MEYTLPELPYEKSALQPFLSEHAVDIHYEKHHRGYVNKLNKALSNQQHYEGLSLEELICQTPLNSSIFNVAAQTWNHTFFWHSISPDTDHQLSELSPLAREIKETFGSLEKMLEQFKDVGKSQFGSGWVWLVKNQKNTLEICSTANAESVLRDNKQPLLICDVWEHAYYIDYRNDRASYLEAFVKRINWKFVENNFNEKT
ncbi:MAG: superoxide dismutase [Porticoccus sp.]|nr:superoxide dismutase [Porticoccus sp.]